MFERLQKPFLTVETGEAYQPIRLTYDIFKPDALMAILDGKQLHCLKKKKTGAGWELFWQDECDVLHFESLDSYQRKADKPVRLATLSLRDSKMYLNLPSFKRACLLAPHLHTLIDPSIARIHTADFINKVFGLDQRLPHGFTELFDDVELDNIVRQRVTDYENIQQQCELATTADDALKILQEYTDKEAHKPLPYAERYEFMPEQFQAADPDVMFLGFYIFLRGRELVAIRRWFGQTEYTLADAAEETIETVFGGMDIDIIE